MLAFVDDAFAIAKYLKGCAAVTSSIVTETGVFDPVLPFQFKFSNTVIAVVE